MPRMYPHTWMKRRGTLTEPEWLPTDIDGCVLWLPSDLGITKNGSDRVSLREDQSLNNDASQVTDAKKPVWFANQIDGHPSIRFDSVDDYMSGPLSIIGNSLHLFMVVNRISLPEAFDGYFVALGNGQTNDYNNTFGMILFDSSPNVYAFRAANKSYGAYPGFGTWFLLETKWDGSNNTTYINKVAQTPVADTQGNFNIVSYYLACRYIADAPGYFHNIEDAEIICYNSPLSSDNQQLVWDYIESRYPSLW